MFWQKTGLVRVKDFCNSREWGGTQQRLFLTSRESKAGCTLPPKNSFSEKYILNDHFFPFLNEKRYCKNPEKWKRWSLFDELGPCHVHISLQDDIFNVSFSPEIFCFWNFAKKSKWKPLQFFDSLNWEQFYVLHRWSCWGLGKNSISHFESSFRSSDFSKFGGFGWNFPFWSLLWIELFLETLKKYSGGFQEHN